MGKNAKRRKEARLQEKLQRSAPGAGGCGHEGCNHDHHDESLRGVAEVDAALNAVFRNGQHEAIPHRSEIFPKP